MTLSIDAMKFIHDRRGQAVQGEPHANTGTFGRGWERADLGLGDDKALLEQTGGPRNDGFRPRTAEELDDAKKMFRPFNPARLSEPAREEIEKQMEAALRDRRVELAKFLAS